MKKEIDEVIKPITDFRVTESLISRFKKTFLSESPIALGKGHSNALDIISNNINERLQLGYKKESLGRNCFRLESESFLYYWFVNNNNEIILAVEIEKQSLAAIVRFLGKDIRYAHKEPFAYKLFEIIIEDLQKPLRLISDESITIDGFNNWLKLFDRGYKIFIYNNENNNAGQSLKQLRSKNEMEEFYGKEAQYKNWQYVVTESKKIDNIIDSFMLRRTRELSGQADRDS